MSFSISTTMNFNESCQREAKDSSRDGHEHLLPIVVHPLVDRVFSIYVKCTCAVRERLCRFEKKSM